jgi:hypothetical protein
MGCPESCGRHTLFCSGSNVPDRVRTQLIWDTNPHRESHRVACQSRMLFDRRRRSTPIDRSHVCDRGMTVPVDSSAPAPQGDKLQSEAETKSNCFRAHFRPLTAENNRGGGSRMRERGRREIMLLVLMLMLL